MSKRRIFIALDISDELKNLAEFYLKPFFKNELVRITGRENLHLTVVFCGYLDEAQLRDLKGVTERAVSHTGSFYLFPTSISFAPPGRQPRMIWMTFKKSAEYENLSKIFTGFADSKMLEPIPHVTLARFEPRNFHRFNKFLPERGIDISKETSPLLINSVNIMESHLSRQGAEYEKLFSFNLKRNYKKNQKL